MKPYLICPSCGSDDVMKNGTTRRGKQNYKCRDCGRQFVENPQWKPIAPDSNKSALPIAGRPQVVQSRAVGGAIHSINP